MLDNPILEAIIARKISYCQNLKQWLGYLRPDEVIYLVDTHAVRSSSDIKQFRDKIAVGNMNPRWFYMDNLGSYSPDKYMS